jgi:Sulfotransferase domain
MEGLYTVLSWRMTKLLARADSARPKSAIYGAHKTRTFSMHVKETYIYLGHRKAHRDASNNPQNLDCRRLAEPRQAPGGVLQALRTRAVHRTKDRLLEFRSEDGWAPLCEFLDKPAPRAPYPHVNKGNNLVYLHCILFGVTALKIFAKGAVWAAVGVAIWAAWCYLEYSKM